jgi:hypothetical protein
MFKIVLWQFAATLNLKASDIGFDGPHTIDAQKILDVVYMIAGMIAVLIIVVAGFIFVTANGDSNRIQKAKMAILGAVIGLIVILLAFVITQFVIFKVA